MPDIAGQIVGEIDHADLGASSCDADGADEQAHARFLMGEDMLDGSANLRTSAVGPRHRLAHRAALRLLVMDVRDIAVARVIVR